MIFGSYLLYGEKAWENVLTGISFTFDLYEGHMIKTFFLYSCFIRFSEKVLAVGQLNLVSIFLRSKSRCHSMLR